MNKVGIEPVILGIEHPLKEKYWYIFINLYGLTIGGHIYNLNAHIFNEKVGAKTPETYR